MPRSTTRQTHLALHWLRHNRNTTNKYYFNLSVREKTKDNCFCNLTCTVVLYLISNGLDVLVNDDDKNNNKMREKNFWNNKLAMTRAAWGKYLFVKTSIFLFSG